MARYTSHLFPVLRPPSTSTCSCSSTRKRQTRAEEGKHQKQPRQPWLCSSSFPLRPWALVLLGCRTGGCWTRLGRELPQRALEWGRPEQGCLQQALELPQRALELPRRGLELPQRALELPQRGLELPQRALE